MYHCITRLFADATHDYSNSGGKIARRVYVYCLRLWLPRLSQGAKHLIQVILDGESFGKSLAWDSPSGGKEPQHLPWHILQHMQKVRRKWFCQSCHTYRIQKAPYNGQQELWIMGLLLHNPSLYLGEICQKIAHVFEIQVSPATVCHIIHRHGFTRKRSNKWLPRDPVNTEQLSCLKL